MVQQAHLREPIADAHAARLELGLEPDQPVDDLLSLVENKADIPTAILDLGQGVAGAYVIRRGLPFIFINGCEPVIRQRFTLAHEFGHHRLGHSGVVDGVQVIEGNTTDPIEQQANAFAAELMAPEPAVHKWMTDHGEPLVDLNIVVRIGAWFGISALAAFYRLVSTGTLQRPKQRSELRRQLDRGQHGSATDVLGVTAIDDSLARVAREERLPRLPSRLRDNALTAYANGLISLDELARTLRRNREEVKQLVDNLGVVPADPELDW